MKYLLVLLFLCGVSSADSVDYFTFYGRANLIYSFSLPANPTPYSVDDANGFELRSIPVSFTQDGQTILGPDGESTIPFGMEFFKVGNEYRFEMGCGLGTAFWDYCFIQQMASFDGPLFSGDPSAPVFILGDHDGILTISDSVSMPEGSELALVALSGLAMFGGFRHRRR